MNNLIALMAMSLQIYPFATLLIFMGGLSVRQSKKLQCVIFEQGYRLGHGRLKQGSNFASYCCSITIVVLVIVIGEEHGREQKNKKKKSHINKKKKLPHHLEKVTSSTQGHRSVGLVIVKSIQRLIKCVFQTSGLKLSTFKPQDQIDPQVKPQ